MAKKKGKRTVSSSSVSPNADVPPIASPSEITISKLKMTVKETGYSFESEDKYENTSNEILHEETAVSGMKKEKFAIAKEKNKGAAMSEEEKHEEKSMDVDQESNIMGQKCDKQNEIGGVDKAEEEDEQEEEEDEENTNGNSNNKENVRAGSLEKVKRLWMRRKKEVAYMGSEIEATRAEDKLGSWRNKKASKRIEGMGMVFICNSETKKDCYHYKVLGLRSSKKEIVQKVYKGMRLFLFDVDLRLMYGIYKAKGPGGYNLESKAFKSAFPAQVRFTVLEDCLPLSEQKFRRVIKDNYYTRNKFNCQLTSEQVENLCKLFTANSRGSKSKKSGSNIRAETRSFIDWDQSGYQNLDIGRRPTLVADGLHHDQPIIMDPAAFTVVLPETHAFVEPHRIGRQRLDEGRRHYSLVADPRYHDLHRMYKSTLAPRSHLSPLPPSPAPSDVNSWEQRLGGIDSGSLDLELRQQDEIRSRDPYNSFRASSYHNALYSPGVPQEYAPPGRQAEYRSAGVPSIYNLPGLRAEYRVSGVKEYDPPGLRADYRSPGVPIGYDPPGLRAEYRLSGVPKEFDRPGLRAEYRLSGGVPKEFDPPGLRAEYRYAGPSGYARSDCVPYQY
ncbi:uncharacterized protein LOC127796477 [Diospyros lotus]|uniref:uncharacterized protein LOC127796477 n=1 Tax=Diospyros lotus TaxID=55363 RepID=UPI00225317E4|nr:uncharacterized protein LOC127796477 [Diospyros lotus]